MMQRSLLHSYLDNLTSGSLSTIQATPTSNASNASNTSNVEVTQRHPTNINYPLRNPPASQLPLAGWRELPRPTQPTQPTQPPQPLPTVPTFMAPEPMEAIFNTNATILSEISRLRGFLLHNQQNIYQYEASPPPNAEFINLVTPETSRQPTPAQPISPSPPPPPPAEPPNGSIVMVVRRIARRTDQPRPPPLAVD